MAQAIIIGGGLSGLSAAHTVIERGGKALVLDKNAFLGGNSTKATSGINASGTHWQRNLGIPDSAEIFENDTAKSAGEGLRPELVRVLTHESGPSVEWLWNSFGLKLDKVSRLGAHSQPRTHRGGERFPGAMITMTLMEKLEERAEEGLATIVCKATAKSLLEENGKVVGVEFEKDKQLHKAYGPVILCTGGFGADFSSNSLLAQVENDWKQLKAFSDVPPSKVPSLLALPTTNGDHCTGDGIKMAMNLGANTVDMEAVQVHPTGLVDPEEPEAKVKFLAAEALRGCGGIILDRNGRRFCDDLGKRDYVTSRMWLNEGPFRLVLNAKASKEIEWHVKHYTSRKLMRNYKNAAALAAEMKIPVSNLKETFDKYNTAAKTGNDEFGKKYFHNVPFETEEQYNVAFVTPVVHYCMGGVEADHESQVVGAKGVIHGLFAAGELMGGVHGKNRLGGNSLLDCVVYGRVAGASAARYMMSNFAALDRAGAANRRIGNVAQKFTIEVNPGSVTINFGEGVTAEAASGPATGFGFQSEKSSAATNDPYVTGFTQGAGPSSGASAPAAGGMKKFTWDEVKKHTTEKDCWIVVDQKVYQLEEFLPDHPGGKKAPLIYAGKDATEEFNMLHKPEILDKYAKEYLIGTVDGPDPSA
jgi:flavocytochrome c